MRPGQPLLVNAGQAATPESILGANLIDVWSAADATLVSSEVSTVVGRKYGLALPAPSSGQRPGYTASNSNFAGSATVNCARSGNRFLRNAAVPSGFLPVGSRPFAWVIGRITVTPASVAGALIAVRVDANYDADIRQHPDNSWFSFRFYNGATRFAERSGLNTSPHLFGTHIDAALGSSLYFDNALFATQAAGTTATASDPVIAIALGANGVGADPVDMETPMWGICKNPPTTLELTALYALAQQRFGV